MFDLERTERTELLDYVWNILEAYYSETSEIRVTPVLDRHEIINYVSQFDFDHKFDKKKALQIICNGLTKYAVHTPHPSYFGLFNPRTSFASILADLITATFNPQMAAWSHAPFAAEVENYLCREFGGKFGYSKQETRGTFCGGGAEANLTAIMCAIRNAFPQVKEQGLLKLEKQPLIYCSAQSHHSVARGAVLTGLGHQAVRSVPVDDTLSMKTNSLKRMIEEDRKNGFEPFMVVATAGTTGPGSIDPLAEIASICEEFNLWFHVDAAYGGAIAIHPEYSKLLKGVELSDSIIMDVHKWMSVPMATSIFLTRHTDILGETFGMPASYMPRDSKGMTVQDPYMNSIQWSRRFIGLKLYLSLIFYGWKGYEALIEKYMSLNALFREELQKRNWKIINASPLPVVCFRLKDDIDSYHQRVLSNVLASGETWFSIYPINEQDCLRVCFNNYNTTEKEIYSLLKTIENAMADVEAELN